MKHNKSNNYDWFQAKGSDEKRSPKSTLKLIWKFVRMFLYLSLFVFTMTGCVQIFVIKVDPKIGRGVEFYANADEVSPHVANFSFNKTSYPQTTKTNAKNIVTTTPAFDSYSLNIDQKDTIWIHGDKELADIRKVVGKPLQDAYKGANEAVAITGNVPTVNTTDGEVLKKDGKPLVLSSLGNKDPETATNLKIKGLGNKIFVNPIGTKFIDPTTLIASNERQAFAFNIINGILERKLASGTTIGGWIQQALNTDFVKNSKTNDGQRKIADANNIYLILFAYAGIKIEIPGVAGATRAKLSFAQGYMPGVGSNASTSYRPLVTWGDAWQRGPFYGIFVYPIATIAAKIISGLGDMNGWETLITIFIVVWAIRAFTFMLSFKSTMQQTKMQELAGKKAIIDAKYANHKGNKQMEQRQKQEVSELYKKEGISPLGSIGTMFLTMPFFLAMWRVIGALPHIKSTVWAGINFSATSYKELMTWTEWQYLPLMILAAFFAVMQQLVPRLLTKKRSKNRINVHQKAAMKKNNKTQNIMMVVFGVMGLIFSAGMQIYWVAGGMWMIVQSYATHRFFIYQKSRRRKFVK